MYSGGSCRISRHHRSSARTACSTSAGRSWPASTAAVMVDCSCARSRSAACTARRRRTVSASSNRRGLPLTGDLAALARAGAARMRGILPLRSGNHTAPSLPPTGSGPLPGPPPMDRCIDTSWRGSRAASSSSATTCVSDRSASTTAAERACCASTPWLAAPLMACRTLQQCLPYVRCHPSSAGLRPRLAMAAFPGAPP